MYLKPVRWMHGFEKMGNRKDNFSALVEVNKVLLKSALHKRKGITLEIDATEIISNKTDAKWTYKSNKGFMPMVGHVPETGQVVACDFRAGNASPSRENFEFIQQCEKSLPDGCFVQSLRIDAAGYQTKIIRHCDENTIRYAIRAKMNAGAKELLENLSVDVWQPLLDKKGNAIDNQETYRTSNCIGDYKKHSLLSYNASELRN